MRFGARAIGFALAAALGVAALSYGGYRLAANLSAQGYKRFAEDGLARLEVLAKPPAQPQAPMRALDGLERTLADYRGKVVLLNLWADWCAPCLRELPSLDRLEAARGGPDFVVLPVAINTDRADAESVFKEIRIERLPILLATFAFARELGAVGMPVTVLYDPEGRELARLQREADWSSPEALALIDAAIAEAKAARAELDVSAAGG